MSFSHYYFSSFCKWIFLKQLIPRAQKAGKLLVFTHSLGTWITPGLQLLLPLLFMVCPYALAHLVFKYRRHDYMCSYCFATEIVGFHGISIDSAFAATEWRNLCPLGLNFLLILSQTDFWILIISFNNKKVKLLYSWDSPTTSNAETQEILTKVLKKPPTYTYKILSFGQWPHPARPAVHSISICLNN